MSEVLATGAMSAMPVMTDTNLVEAAEALVVVLEARSSEVVLEVAEALVVVVEL